MTSTAAHLRWLLGCAWLCCAGAQAQSAMPVAAPWPDNLIGRVEALALLQTFNAELLSHDSATLTLERWCEAHHLASPARIVAERDSGAEKALPPERRLDLGLAPGEPVRYRKVRLKCGSRVLSEADNWYVPSRLTRDMNKLLEDTDTPFGKVVATLHFKRRTLSSTLLWRPLPEGWEMTSDKVSKGGGQLNIPAAILEHRALLTLPDGTPFSEVVETYTGHILGFPAPYR